MHHDFIPTLRQLGYGLQIQPDHKIVVTGQTQPMSGGDGFNMMVARYTPTGDPDTTFGPQGFVLIHAGQPEGALDPSFGQ